MIDSVSNTAISTLLRAQTSSQSAGVTALKTNKQATNAIIDQLQETLTQGKQSGTLTSQQGNRSNQSMPSGNLPRGSLVNLLV